MAELVHIQVSESLIPTYIMDFPEKAERSVTGSIHIRPGTLLITEDELSHLSVKYPQVVRHFAIVSRPQKTAETTPEGITGAVAAGVEAVGYEASGLVSEPIVDVPVAMPEPVPETNESPVIGEPEAPQEALAEAVDTSSFFGGGSSSKKRNR